MDALTKTAIRVELHEAADHLREAAKLVASERPELAQEIREALAQIAYTNQELKS